MSERLILTTVTSIIQATNKIKVFRLDHEFCEYKFKPGQWIDLYAPIDGKNIGGYTIISSMHERQYIELAIRESNSHPVTKFLHEKIKIGDTLKMTQGQGNFFWSQELIKTPLVFIAGGIGITPILSMVRSIDREITPVKVFYSISYAEDILFRDELVPYTFFTATKTGEKRITVETLKNNNVDFNSNFFICGPRSMIDNFCIELKKIGVPLNNIHFEKWW